MPTNFQPTTFETPDSSQAAASAVTGLISTGHAATTSSVSITAEQSATQTKTARWATFGDHPTTSRLLRFDWSLSGSIAIVGAAPDSTVATVSFLIEYTVDDGDNWLTAVTRSYSLDASGTLTPSDSDSVTIDIGAGNTSAVQVRDKITATATSTLDPTVSADASITPTISAIHLATEILRAPAMISMM